MPFTPDYSKWGFVWLLRVCGPMTTSELAEAFGASASTTWYRCKRLEEEGRIEGMRFGDDGLSQTWLWAAVEE